MHYTLRSPETRDLTGGVPGIFAADMPVPPGGTMPCAIIGLGRAKTFCGLSPHVVAAFSSNQSSEKLGLVEYTLTLSWNIIFWRLVDFFGDGRTDTRQSQRCARI